METQKYRDLWYGLRFRDSGQRKDSEGERHGWEMQNYRDSGMGRDSEI